MAHGTPSFKKIVFNQIYGGIMKNNIAITVVSFVSLLSLASLITMIFVPVLL